MKTWIARARRWYLWRFHGISQAKGGTRWHEHNPKKWGRNLLASAPFYCVCGTLLRFVEEDYAIVHQDHTATCARHAELTVMLKGDERILEDRMITPKPCTCPIRDARYIKICPMCSVGHWVNATPKGGRT